MLKSTVQAASPRRTILMAGATAALALAALGFGGAAQARSDVQFSVGVALPGAQIGVSNAYPVYSQPVYHPQPVYVQPQPVYYPPRPVYYQPAPVYYQPQPVYYQRPPVYIAPPVYYRGHGYRHGHRGHGHGGHDR
ncbi:hypothetical protein [Polaromonas sp.]|uniref:hypothetical protein n=1 Tax=Polaromonas sp. TaxID=1869339 RepID=UPI003263E416